MVKGVDQIAQEMEQLQKSIEALEAHGLNVNDFNFDESYLNSANFGTSCVLVLTFDTSMRK